MDLGRTLMIVVAAAALFSVAAAQNQLVSYQGYLTDASGQPVADGSYSIRFSIWDDSSAGTQLWTELHPSVHTTGGTFSVLLGSVAPLSTSIFENENMFLQIAIGLSGPITPRTRLSSVPKAATASRVDGDIETGEGFLNLKSADSMTMVSIYAEDKGGPAHLTLFNPDISYPNQPLVEMSSQTDGGHIEFFPAGDIPRDPAIRMGITPSPFDQGRIEFLDASGSAPHDPYVRMGVEPSPFKGGRLDFFEPSLGWTASPVVRMGTEPSPFKGSIKLFDPQPEPPALLSEWNVQSVGGEWASYFGMSMDASPNPSREALSISVAPSTGASIKMFDPQPEPPARVFEVSANFSGRTREVKMELLNDSTNRETEVTPARVKVGHDTNPLVALGEFRTSADSCILSMHGSILGPLTSPPIVITSSFGAARVGIGTASPTEELHVVGDICYTGTIGACSDVRYKKDIGNIEGALDKVTELRGVNYHWKVDQYPEQQFDRDQHVGFIAQEVQQVVPEVVQKHSDGTLSVDYSRLTPLLVEAIKELRAENRELQKRIEQLEHR